MNEQYKQLTIKDAFNLASPHTWAASAVPALFGILYCIIKGLQLPVWKMIFLFIACVLLQCAVNALNDYVDFVKGTDDKEDCLEESDAVLVYAGVAPKSALYLGLGYLLGGIILGLLCCIGKGILPVVIGIVGAVVIGAYSAGPLPISYLPIGEVVSGTVMGGLIPLGVCACADGTLHAEVLLYSLPMILGIALIMLCNNGCDIEKDMEAGRSTLPVRIGRENSVDLYHFSIAAWMTLLIVEPIFLIGPGGLLCGVLLWFSKDKLLHLWKLTLDPAQRIDQMKSISKANFIANGSYCLTLIFFILTAM